MEFTEHDFVEPPKNTHKKKTEKEKEKERQERELAQKAADHYRKKQEEMNRPVNPREPLKRTADNNWVHVTCAVWMPEVKFGNALALGPAEGIPSVPRSRYDETCKVCKRKDGACVNCLHCRAPGKLYQPQCVLFVSNADNNIVHVECAHQNGYLLGFEITPVKGSRRDQHNIVAIGADSGIMAAAVWCKEHIPQKGVVHRMQDPVPQTDGQGKDAPVLNALQLYVQNYKQADLALTGNVRKANLVNIATKTTTAGQTNLNRRQSTAAVANSAPTGQRQSSIDSATDMPLATYQCGEKVCITCGIDVSPRWWPAGEELEKRFSNLPPHVSCEVSKFVAQRTFQCHKCKKAKKEFPPYTPSSMEALGTGPETKEPSRTPAPNPSPITNHAPNLTHTVNRMADLGNPWTPRAPAVQPASSAPSSIAPPPLHPPTVGAPPPLPLTAPLTVTSPMAAPTGTGVPLHHYPPAAPSYGDWHRSPPPSIHQMNGGSGAPSPIHHNHLRELRPPPIAQMSHHQGPPLQHGLGQPIPNGIPSSPPRRSHASVGNGTSPYMPPYHSAHNPLHGLTNGSSPPARASEHSFSQGLLGSRSPFLNTLGSPPMSRDGISMSREPSLNNNMPSRSSDSRPASGASANASLRNLLS